MGRSVAIQMNWTAVGNELIVFTTINVVASQFDGWFYFLGV
jgi:hypothetical protein